MKKTIGSIILSLAFLQGCTSTQAESDQAPPPAVSTETRQSESTETSLGNTASTSVETETSSQLADNPEEGVVGKDVPYVPTPHEVVESMLDLAQVDSDDVVYDLGSGDGRIVIAAAQRGAKAVGVDLDTALLAQSRENAEAQGVSDKTEFRQQDIFETDLSEASVVTMYLLPGVNNEMRPRLLSQLKPGSRIVSHAFDMDDWEPDHKQVVDGKTIYLWTVPAK